MKPKKSKLSLGPGGIKGFFVEHVEKIVLGIVLLAVVGFVYFGSTVETFPESKTPATLLQTVQQATNKMETPSWDKVKETVLPPSIDNPIVIRVTPEQFSIRTMDPPIQPSRSKRRDPKIYAPTQLEVAAMVAGVGMIPGEEEIAAIDLKYDEMVLRQQAPLVAPEEDPAAKKKKKRPGRDREMDILGEAAANLGGAGGILQPRVLSEEDREEILRNGARVSTQAIARTRNIISLKALIPYQKQLLEYQDALAGVPQYVKEERDVPTYVFFKVERADVTDDPNADPAKLKWVLLSTAAARNLPFVEKAEWEVIPEELVDPSAVLPETDRFGALTLPVPPAVLTDLRTLAGHTEVAWAKDINEGLAGSETTKTGTKKGDSPEEGPDAVMEGPESPDMAAPGTERVPGGGRPTPGIREGRMSSGRGGRSGGYESGSTNPDAVYKLFRFIDFDVQRGRLYRYRVNVMLEDPNHPQVPTNASVSPSGRDGSGAVGNDPPVVSLDKEVEQRLRDLKKEEDKTGKRKWYRETEWSEPSPIISVPDPLQFVGGTVSAAREQPIAGTFARVAVGEATAKTLVVQWDDAYATNVVTEEEVQRGDTLNFVKDADALHPIKLEYVELKDYPTRTDSVVVDIRGGERLPGSSSANPQTAPGQVAIVDHTGKLIVLNEADDLKDWHRHGKVDPITVEAPRPEETSEGERGFSDLTPPRSKTRRGRGE